MTEPESNPTPTTGMTTKVVKGSFWTLVGQLIPPLVSLVSTPFVIRFLGSEGYGVLILIGLVPAYFGFADFGMGIASTKFGAEEFGRGDRRGEATVVQTAALIALLTSLLVAIPLFLFSDRIIAGWFNVSADYQGLAAQALRIASISFVFGILSSVVNTPLLVRLRMDLNTIVGTIPKLLVGFLTPLVLYLGGFVTEAIWVAFGGSVLIFFATLGFSGRTLPELLQLSIARERFRPLLKFGGNWLIAMVAAILLVNVEKFFLARYTSTTSLAHYSVAFTFANMATMFTAAMTQSLVPAFTMLMAKEDRSEFELLFGRSVRMNFIWILPALMMMAIVARPFFTIWAGAEFGAESSVPFYILLAGLFFNILAYVPQCSITASGRTDILAKLYWFELLIYIASASWLVSSYGLVGAALAWSLRVVIDAFIIGWLARRIAGASFDFVRHFFGMGFAALLLAPPVIYAFAIDNFSLWLAPLALASLAVYAIVIWKKHIGEDERKWIESKFDRLLNTIR